jgi:hypothetical protein
MEIKRVGMTAVNQFDNFSFWRGKDIYNFMDIPLSAPCIWIVLYPWQTPLAIKGQL